MGLDISSGKAREPRGLWFRPENPPPPAALSGKNEDARALCNEIAADMVATAKSIETEQSGRRTQGRRQAMVWSNRWLGSSYDLAAPADERAVEPWNVVGAVVANGNAHVTRNKVKLVLETSGAEVKLQRDAKEATRWINGVFAANDVADVIAPTWFVDAAVWDAGNVVVRVQKRRLKIERVFPDEVIVSDLEALYGKPHQAFIKTWRPMHSLIADYPEKAEAIRAAAGKEDAHTLFAGTYRPDMVAVYEGWSIQGLHVVAVDGPDGYLAGEPWAYDKLPLVPLYIERPQAGWWGRGWAQMLLGYQMQLYALNDWIEECVRLGASPKWFVYGAGVNREALGNRSMTIVDVPASAPQRPELVTYDAIPEDLLEERQRCWDQALKDVGMSDWGVAGENPGKGLSGDAMEQLRDREAGRLVTVGQEFERAHVDLAEVCLMLGPRCSDWKVQGRGPGDRDLRDVDFSQIAELLEKAPWKVQPPAPVSAFPSSPTGKRLAIERYVEKQILTPQQGASLLDLTDIDAEATLIGAVREDILDQIDDILIKGKPGYRTPELVQIKAGGNMGPQMMAQAWLRARRQGVDEKKLDLLLQWINEAEALMTAAAPPKQPASTPVAAVAGPAPQPVVAPVMANPQLASEAVPVVAPGM